MNAYSLSGHVYNFNSDLLTIHANDDVIQHLGGGGGRRGV